MAEELVALQCKEHSGMVVWIKIGCALLGLLCSLFSYSTFVQFPTIKEELHSIASAQDKRITIIENDVGRIKAYIELPNNVYAK